jgi:flavodoxin
MNNLVLYYSRTGNTETVAKEISKAVNGQLKKLELRILYTIQLKSV